MRYDIPELVWNSYQVTLLDGYADIEALLETYAGNIWKVKEVLEEQNIHISIDLEEACFDFIESHYEEVQING